MIAKEKYSEIIKEIFSYNFQGKIAVDATVGRGNDTIQLLEAVGEKGFVYGYDIQKEAIEHTMEKLKGHSNYQLFLKSHESFQEVEKADLIFYNLGYLPRSNKKIYTEAETTVRSLKSAIKILNLKGLIVVVSYVGHENSKKERIAVETFLETLEQQKFIVEKRSFLNQVHTPPTVYLIERKAL